ncbi:hypothetical protein GQX74_003307 [Glossina fuscipes]|nr:hypothetical protein GQX74_003307 [Glossina fuscipes]
MGGIFQIWRLSQQHVSYCKYKYGKSCVLAFLLLVPKGSDAGFLQDINTNAPVAATRVHYPAGPIAKFLRNYAAAGNVKFAQAYSPGVVYTSNPLPYLSADASYTPSINYHTRLHPITTYTSGAMGRSTAYQFATPLPITPPYEAPVAPVNFDNYNGPRTVLRYGPPITTTTTTTYTTQSHLTPLGSHNW